MPGLLSLPPELRIEIYQYLLPETMRIDYPCSVVSWLPLAQTCQQTRMEIFRELGRNTVFVYTYFGIHDFSEELVPGTWTPDTNHLCIEIDEGALCEDILQARIDKRSTASGGSPWPRFISLSKQAEGLARWLEHFQSLKTLEWRLCSHESDIAMVEEHLIGLFGRIETLAEIVISSCDKASVGHDVLVRIASKLKGKQIITSPLRTSLSNISIV